jgi:hypothetical protein
MGELIRGDNTKGIKNVGELALRISKFDSYRLFTLYENVKERKVMDVSGNQKYYLVFKSPKKEIRIPEYEPNGFFEVDKVNGCILFKITKKNAEDILSMKTAGEKIFHIVRVFEERDEFDRVLSVTDEVEVYNGKWGDDIEFSAFSTQNKIDLLTKALAAQVDKNANLLKEYNDLLEQYNQEAKKNSELEKELEAMRSERDALETTVSEYLGDTYDGTVLSTDTKYIAFESTLENVTFTEEQYSAAVKDVMTKGSVDLSNVDIDDPRMKLSVIVYEEKAGVEIRVYKNDVSIGSAVYNQQLEQTRDADDGDVFTFECVGGSVLTTRKLYVEYIANNQRFKDAVKIDKPQISVGKNGGTRIKATMNYKDIVDVVGEVGTLKCVLK